MRCAKVIATAFNDGREVRTIARFPQHNQNVPTKWDVLAMLGASIYLEKKFDAGTETDTIIINNDTGCREGNEYLERLNEAKTADGRIYTNTRENVGGALGAFDWAFKRYRHNYDYWLFTEDDIFVGWPCYMAELQMRFAASKNVGLLTLIGYVRDHPLGSHAHGGLGFTSTEVLGKIVDTYGSLPHPTGEWDKLAYIREGETKLTKCIEELGYDIIEYPLPDWNDKIHPYVR